MADATQTCLRLSALVVSAATLLSGCGSASGGGGSKAAGLDRGAWLAAPDVGRGAAVYRKACAVCHGLEGDGRGQGAADLDPPPRDLRRAVYRYRSTPSGSLPQDRDLFRTVLVGVADTTMPAWRDLLTEQQVVDVVAFVKGFSARFEEEEIDESIAIPSAPPFDAASVERGQKIYEQMQCGKCHGKEGRGDGWASADEMKDDLGRVTPARDFTRGIYRSGNRRQDLYRSFFTGLDGTPMPGYEGSLEPAAVYDLVNFMLSLERGRGFWSWLTTPPSWYEPTHQRVER